MKLVLEQRYLFDGSAAAVSHHVHADQHDAGAHPDSAHPDSAHPDSAHPWGTHGAAAQPGSSHPGDLPPAFAEAAFGPRATGSSSAGRGETVLFVDQRVTNWQSLVAGVKPGVDVVVLDPTRDGITQVTQALAGLDHVRDVEFLTDGTPGAITLGSTTLDVATLGARAGEITAWSSHLASNAAVVFWGCDVGEGGVGQAFVADVHTLTGATVAASSDATGAAALGGDWTLEVSSGPLHRDVNPFTRTTLDSYTGILDTPAPTVTLSLTPGIATTTPGTVLLGDTLTANVSFANDAAHAAGYAPYVDLFVQSGLTLSGTAYAGASITGVQHIALSGGSVINPLTKASEAVPSGYAGGTLYVIPLPYGSFTPGEPAISFTATFTMAGTPSLVGSNLGVEAIGGFQYGAVATGGANIEGTAVATSDTVELIESYTTVTTMYGEGETATGPDFPVDYVVHLITAPAVTSGNPIDALNLSLLLPNGVAPSGGLLSASGGGTASIDSVLASGGIESVVKVSYAALSGQQTISIPVYVPEFYQYTDSGHAQGTPILDPSSGDPVLVSINPPYTYGATAWNGIALSSETGTVSGADFYAKSLAVQLTADTGSAVPGQDIHYTLHFEVSDYFGLDSLTLNALMSDGLTVDPSAAPTLSVAGKNGGVGGDSSFAVTTQNTGVVNGETVQTSGGGGNWSYLFDGASGTTALRFDVGAQLSGLYGAGTVGTLGFAGTVLTKYPTASDNVSGAGGFLRENDTVSTSSSNDSAANLYNFVGPGYSASIGAISDNTDTPVDRLNAGSLTLQVAYVDGAAYIGQAILPGDTVVYELVYTLPEGGNFADFNLTGYLPEPVFSAIDPAHPDSTDYATSATGGFTQTAIAAALLGSGDYSYVLTSGLVSDGVIVGGGTGAEPTNGVTFSVQAPGGSAYFNSGNQTAQTVTIDFAVTASSQPFVNGLHLTAQGDSTFTPAHAATFTRQTTAQVNMGEPSLALYQGVVSIVDDSGTSLDSAAGIAWSNGATKAPNTVFASAGDTTGVFASGSGPATLVTGDDNLNLSGAQAGDTVRIVDAVQNTGAYAAYDVVLKDALAQGLGTSNVSDLSFTLGDGTMLKVFDPTTDTQLTGAAAVNAFFSGTGVLLVNGTDTSTAVLGAATKAGNPADIVYVTYDVTLPDSTPTAATLTGMASIVAWTNHDVYAAAAGSYTLQDSLGNDANFADDTALGLTLTDTAQIATAVPSLTDAIIGGTDLLGGTTTVPTNTYPTHAATTVYGETVDLQATISLPQGISSKVTLTDKLPAGLTPITTPGSYTVRLTPNDGSAPVDLTADASWNGQALTLTLPASMQVNAALGGDKAASIVIDYQAVVAQKQAGAIDTSSTTPADVTLKDSYTASAEGLHYGTTTATSLATTTGSVTKSGVENDITVTNPVVTATLTELNGTAGQTVYSQEEITYQLTLTNSSATATAFDTGATIQLPNGLTYVAGSLAAATGSGTLSDANIASGGATPTGEAIGGFTIAPGGTAVLTFEARVDNDLTAGTTLKVTAQPTWTSLPDNASFDPANVNTQAQAYSGARSTVQNGVATLSPSLSIVGASNDSAGLGTAGGGKLFDPTGSTLPTSVTTTDGEIVRMRATLQLPEGSNSGVAMSVALPNGLTLDPNYATDGSVTVLLVSPNQDITTTLSGTGLQLAEGLGGINTAKLDLGTGSDTTDPVVATLPASAIQVSGQSVTFNLGTLGNNDGSALPNYVIVEFNAVVGNSVAGGSSLHSTMQGSANATTTATVDDYASVVAPSVSLAKQVTGISYNNDGSATVTYVDTITNNGDGPAYGLDLTDPGAGVGTAAYGGLTSGTGTGIATSTSGGSFTATLASLGAGGSQNFTFAVTIPANQVGQAVSDAASTASVVSAALDPAREVGGLETLAGTSTTPLTHTATASAGLDLISGSVNQDVSATQGSDSSLAALPGQTISVTFTGQTGTETLHTQADGSYAILVPDTAATVSVTAHADTPGAPSGDVLDNHPDLSATLSGTTPAASGSNPVTLTFAPAADKSYTGVAFDFWTGLDTAPVLDHAPSGAATVTVGGTPVLLFPAGTVADAELNASFAHDFSGTTLTIQRYTSGSATPNAGDAFTGSGTAVSGLYLDTGSGHVLYNGTQVGSFTETGGVLAIHFAATGVSDATVDNVLQHLAYNFNGAGNTLTPGVVIGAQIDDANNDPIGLNGVSPDASGPHDQGPGGDLLSNLLTATVNVLPQAVADTFHEPNDADPSQAPYPVTVDATADLGDILHTATPPSQITLTITNAQPEDVLAFADTADIHGSYGGGTLTLTAVGGHTPSLAAWQAALRSVTYYDTSSVPVTTTRDVAIAVTAGANVATGQATIAIVPVNDSPILDTGVAVALNDSLEYQGSGTPTPSGAVGTPVSQLIALGHNVTDPDGAGLLNGGIAAPAGIAITGFRTTDAGGTSEGTWYYSTNNGATWTPIPAAVSAQHPLDLAAGALVYFQPTNPDFNGQIPNALTFRAWDGFDGTANGTQADLGGAVAFGQDAADNSAAGAYSIATESLPLMVDSVNNAPVATGSVQLPPVSAATHTPPGETVTQLFAPGFTDTVDQQHDGAANPTGSFANGFAGVAIVGNAATAQQGVWEYSLDGGATWTPIATGVSNTAAVVLPTDARIAFQPEHGFSGTPGGLSVRLIDGSATAIAPALTGASLAADTSVAFTGIDVSANGGSTAVSAATVPLDTAVTPVPDANNHGGSHTPPSAPPPGQYPDDLTLGANGLNYAVTDDFLARGIIPELSLIGSEADHFIIVEQHAVIALPPNLFVDSLPDAHLSFEAKRPDGTPLPSWLSFDATSLTFYGTPPESAVGRVEVVITARDIVDNTASASFSILVGYKQQDLLALISGRRPSGLHLSPADIRHLHLGEARPAAATHGAHRAADAARVHARRDAPAQRPHHGPAPDHHAAAVPVSPAASRPQAAAGPGGFTAALRGAGPMAALARARALLDALDSLAGSPPAA